MKTFRNRSKSRTPGKGNHMEASALKNVILYAFNHRPCDIESNMKISHGVASRIHQKIEKLKLTEEMVSSMTTHELSKLWYHRTTTQNRRGKIVSYLEPDFEAMQVEFVASRQHDNSRTSIKVEQTHANVVRCMYLTEENRKKAEENGQELYSESHVLRMWRIREAKIIPVFRRSYPMGYACELDFTGITIPYTVNDKQLKATLLVMVLPASRMTYVRAIASQKAEHVCPAIADGFKSYGALPDVLVVDNFRAGVSLATKYGGQVSAALNSLSHFFAVEVVTSRPYTARDKGAVEAAVKITNRFIGATLFSKIRQGHEYHSLMEINNDIAPLLAKVNGRKVRGLSKSRNELFAQEKQLMRIPVSWDYQYPDCIVEQRIPDTALYTYRGHQYALPPKWCGATLEVEVANDCISFYSTGSLITTYKRKDNEPGLSTHEDYTPANYLAAECFEVKDVESLLQSWADSIGPNVSRWVSRNISRKVIRRYRNHSSYGLLMLPKTNTEDYKSFDRCVGECIASYVDFPSYAKIKQVWDKQKHSELHVPDKVFNAENFMTSCRNYMLDLTHALCWPVAQLRGEEKSYLRGQNEMHQQFAELAIQLGECNE